MSQVLGQDLSDDSNGEDFSYDSFVEENIGEGKKYSSTEEALQALAKKATHQDTFIETLKLENKGTLQDKQTLEQQLAEAKKLDDLMEVLTGKKEGEGEKDNLPPSSASVSKDELSTLVKDMLQAEKAAEAEKMSKDAAKENQVKAFNLLSGEDGFGSEANAKLAIRRYVGEDKQRADLLDRMGSYQPETVAEFLKLQLKNENKLDGFGDTKLNPGAPKTNHNGQLTWEEAKRIKKDNPALYKSRQFQLKIHNAAANNPNFWNS